MKKRIVQAWIVLVAGLIAETFENLEDNEITFGESLGYTNDLFPLIKAVMGSVNVPSELKEMAVDDEFRRIYTQEIASAVTNKLKKIKILDASSNKDRILSIVEKSLNALIFNSAFAVDIAEDIKAMKKV